MNSSLNDLWARRMKWRECTESAVLFENILWHYFTLLLDSPRISYTFLRFSFNFAAFAQLDTCTNLAGVQLMDEKLLDRMRWLVLAKHCSYRTVKAYIHRARQYILLHDLRHPRAMGMAEVETFRTYLTVDCHLVLPPIIRP